MNFAHAEVATLDPTTMRTLCEEYIATRMAPACWPA